MTELWATFGRIATIIVLINTDFCICLRLNSNFEDKNSRKMKQSDPFKLILLLSLVVYSIEGFCQQIPTINLVMKDGLSSNYVTDIAQDKYGFTWFATKYGLNRFDGDKFTVYLKEPNKELLNSNDINKIATDTINNKVWIANRWMGVNVFDCATQQFSSFLHDKNNQNTLISNEIKDILVTSNGNVWIATNQGLDLYNPDNSQFIHYNTSTVPDFPSNDIMTLAEGSNGDLYIGHTYNGFTIFSPDNNSFKNFTHSSQNKIHFRIILSILYLLIPILKYGLQPTADYRFLIPSEKHSAISKMSVEFTIRYKELSIMSIVPVMTEYG